MTPTLQVDTRQFSDAAADLLLTSSRSLKDFLNGQALAVASRAIRHTEKANRHKMERELGTIKKTEKVRSSSGSKKWVRITKRDIIEDSFAARIINARLRDQGRPLLWGESLRKAAINLIAARVKSVGFIKSGWIPAVRQLSALVYKKPKMIFQRGGGEQVGRPKGFVHMAGLPLLDLYTVTIGNTALLTKSQYSSGGNPLPVAERGLNAAIRETVLDMQETLRRRLEDDTRKYNAR